MRLFHRTQPLAVPAIAQGSSLFPGEGPDAVPVGCRGRLPELGDAREEDRAGLVVGVDFQAAAEFLFGLVPLAGAVGGESRFEMAA